MAHGGIAARMIDRQACEDAAKLMMKRYITDRGHGEVYPETIAMIEAAPVEAGIELQRQMNAGPWMHNRGRCEKCGSVVESLHRHDFAQCPCPAQSAVDGGSSYLRRQGEIIDSSVKWPWVTE